MTALAPPMAVAAPRHAPAPATAGPPRYLRSTTAFLLAFVARRRGQFALLFGFIVGHGIFASAIGMISPAVLVLIA